MRFAESRRAKKERIEQPVHSELDRGSFCDQRSSSKSIAVEQDSQLHHYFDSYTTETGSCNLFLLMILSCNFPP